MKDPLFVKLRADAGILLADIWRAVNHEAPVESEEWLHQRVAPIVTGSSVNDELESQRRKSGLFYFHLN